MAVHPGQCAWRARRRLERRRTALELVAVSGRLLPQPLDYLLTDVGRRHGSVRVRGSRSSVTGSEAEITEILHTRSLRTLHLSRLAPPR